MGQMALRIDFWLNSHESIENPTCAYRSLCRIVSKINDIDGQNQRRLVARSMGLLGLARAPV